MVFDYQAIMFGMGILGTVFGVYHYFRNPQITSEKNDLLMGEKIKELAQSLETQNKTIVNLRDNHLHTIESKMDQHMKDHAVNDRNVATKLMKLETILEERLPKK